MWPKRLWSKTYGLKARFGISLILSAVFCTLLFFVLYNAADYILTEYFANSSFEELQLQYQVESLQEYITSEEIGTKDLSRLEEWERKQPLILLELHVDDECIYSSFNQSAYTRGVSVLIEGNFDKKHLFPVSLADQTALAVIYSDFTYHYYMLSLTVTLAISFILFVTLFLLANRKIIEYICRLNDEVQIIEGGNLDYSITVQGNDEMTDLARSINRMKESFREQLMTEQELHLANRRLVTEMSHDLRTPLTGIMLYTEILRSHRYGSEEQLQDYLEKIDLKAHRMKVLSDHLFAYSLEEFSPGHLEVLTLEKAFSRQLTDMICDLEMHRFSVNARLDWPQEYVQVRPDCLGRILENISSNIIKYAECKVPVSIETITQNGLCGLIFRNVCAPEDETIPGSGVGLDSIRTMIAQMNGVCSIEQTDSAFEITLLFPKQ